MYLSSLTDEEWLIIEPLLPKKKLTRPPTWSKRQILDGIFYQLKNGCNWADLPKDLPPYSTVFWHYKQWRSDGLIEDIMEILHHRVREKQGRKPLWTTLIMIDSQAVKNTCNASIETKGFCFYKSTNGIKRHLAVDILGFPFFTHCTQANISDDQGLIEMLTIHIDFFKFKPVELPKTTILLDNGYHPDFLEAELVKIYPQIMSKIQFQLSPKPSQSEKVQKGKSGFVPVKARWVIERSNAWMERCKSLVKNFERTLENATTKIHLCFVRLMLRRLATS
ncbi:IS5 family transposase [Nostoc sp. UHCC 0870]|uniref:IS5 family transposase n=1 Tax=Nostoc sp. UHCC 0870 TaxID=2914041 RepID=UPI001EE0C3D7|nr:IS5 family transposase [Nostoc sp. UHCC 0870]UKP00977.1 IS5 family transposase [Nostoc sp. UHCC 0870]